MEVCVCVPYRSDVNGMAEVFRDPVATELDEDLCYRGVLSEVFEMSVWAIAVVRWSDDLSRRVVTFTCARLESTHWTESIYGCSRTVLDRAPR